MDKKERIDRCLKQAVENGEIAGGCVLFIENGLEFCYAKAGWAAIESRTPIRRDTIFRLYSMTKPITAAAVMILMEEGLLDLYEPVANYIKTFEGQKVIVGNTLAAAERTMTIRDLLSMTSGLVYPGKLNCAEKETAHVFEELTKRMYSSAPMDTIEFAEKIGNCPLAFHPGESWQYGVSADILGAVVESVSQMRFGDFLWKKIFKPLGMQDTGFYLQEDKKERLADVYENRKGIGLKLFSQDHLGIRIDAKPNSFESGGGGLFSTVDDYARFAQMLLNGGESGDVRIMQPETIRYLTGCGLDGKRQDKFSNWFGLDGHSYGNLMRVLYDRKLAGVLGSEGEYGWDGWLGTYFVNDPVRKITFLFMTQIKDFGTTNLTRKIKNIIFS